MKKLLQTGFITCIIGLTSLQAQEKNYPKGYFRNPLNIKMELVANFGELRNNHWHMGLDIRTQQRENLPVHAAAEGYVAKIKIEPGGFGRAIYINHPNGYTTLYAHLNNFAPAIERWVKEQQYQLERWDVELVLPPHLFPLKKGEFFAYSGNTGGSAGPHVHFEIRDTKTDNCLNPLLFDFPIADAVPPILTRLAMYDRNKSIYVQSPQLMAVKKAGGVYVPAKSNTIRVGTDRVSFALGAIDRFSGTTNPNGIYSSRILLDGVLQSEFILDDIDYDATRYMNAHVDYRYKNAGGGWLQHLSRMPGDLSTAYTRTNTDGVLELHDQQPHQVRIEMRDAAQNLSVLQFTIQYDPSLPSPAAAPNTPRWAPGFVNVFERENFEVFGSERGMYDTVHVSYKEVSTSGAVSPLYTFLSTTIPTHDSVIIRIKPNRNLSPEEKDKLVIKNVSGTKTVVEKANWNGEWAWAKFRQFGTYQAFVDTVAPTINAPAASRFVFTPRDNFNKIKSFRAELDGKWLRFTNNGGRTWIYNFDEKFPPGQHELKVTVEDEAGNITTKTWNVRR